MANKWHSDENLTPEEIIRQIDLEFGSLDNIPARVAREAALEQAQANKKTSAFEKTMANSGATTKTVSKSNTISIEEMRRKYKKNYSETYGDDKKNEGADQKPAPKEEASPNQSIEELEKSLNDAIKEENFSNENEDLANEKENFGDDADFMKEVAAAEYMTPLTEEEKEIERIKTVRSWQLISGFAFAFAARIFLLGIVFGGWLDRNFFGDKGYASMFMLVLTIIYSFYFLYRDCIRINGK